LLVFNGHQLPIKVNTLLLSHLRQQPFPKTGTSSNAKTSL
jgi:hypothetical protein